MSFTQLNDRLVVLVRGFVTSHIYQKSVRISYSEAQAEAAMTHMSTDIDGLANGIPKLHELWAMPLQAIVATFLLTLLVGRAVLLLILPLSSK